MANEETEKEAPKTQGKKKLLIMVGLAVLVIGGGAGGAVVMMGGGDEEVADAHGEEAPTVGEEIVADATGHGEPAGQGEPAGGRGENAAGHGESTGGPGEAAGGHGAPAGGHGAVATVAQAQPITTTYRFSNPFVVNILDNTGRRYLNLIIEIETTSPDVIADIENNVAPLRDALIMLLSSKSMDELTRVEGKIKLKQEIILRMESVLGPGKIKNVYFMEFNMLLL